MMVAGRLFHIDFGYILGRDPKPMPPPIRLSREMVDAMGGTDSPLFRDFKKLCDTAFLHLRRYVTVLHLRRYVTRSCFPKNCCILV